MNRRDFVRLGMGSALVLNAASTRATEPARRLIIDAHCHAGKGFDYGKADSDPWTTFNDPEWTLRRMEEVGIDRTVIFPINNTSYQEANVEIAGYVRRWPAKFIGFAKHDTKTEAGKIAGLLRSEVRELGLKGLKLHGQPSPEMVEAVSELKIPILVHPDTVDKLLPIVSTNPQVSFILAHLGNFASHEWREHVRAIEAAKQLPNLYLDTSSVVFVHYLEQAARDLPATKLIFGSDGPLVDARVELYKIRLLKLSAESEALVLGGNIRRLLGL
jgi:predicted TIM-barrel fold metal-dependent hydrolase